MSSRIREIEGLIRKGEFARARRIILAINLKRIPRAEALPLANLARRMDLGPMSLRILNPIVRPDLRRRGQFDSPASVAEKIEYAASLRRLGALHEAQDILGEINARQNPKVIFQQALCEVVQWRYDLAIPLIRQYLSTFNKACYDQVVAKLNLLQAFVHEAECDEARKLIGELERSIDRKQDTLLYQKLLDLAAQLEIVAENWDEAGERLEIARAAAGRDEANDLLIRKWIAVVHSVKAGKVLPELMGVRNQAIQLDRWETVRDCDFFGARISRDESSLVKLFFATPFESYRSKILTLLSSTSKLPPVYPWSPNSIARPRLTFDLATARILGGKQASMPPGHAIHRLLILLCRDFYVPTPLLSLFSGLYPTEVFNPETSPNRVRQVNLRFRRWARENRVPLEIEEISGSYRLSFKGTIAVAVPRDPLPLDTKELELINLRQALGSQQTPFTALEAATLLDTSKATINRLLRWGIDSGKIARAGNTNQVRYKLAG